MGFPGVGFVAVVAAWSVAFGEDSLGARNPAVTCRGEGSTACAALGAGGAATSHLLGFDRLAVAALALASDPRCVNATVEARYRHPDDFVEEAAGVFRACRFVLIRDATDGDYLDAHGRKLADYVVALREDAAGTTTLGEGRIVAGNGEGRSALLLPEAFATPKLVSPYWIRYLLSHPRFLGEKYELNDVALHLAEPRAPASPFAAKDPYPFGDDSLEVNGVAGHDLPPSAITVAHPLTPLRPGAGALDFCVGSSVLAGAAFSAAASAAFSRAYGAAGAIACDGPGGAMRTDALGLGDVALFDSQTVFRHGANGDERQNAAYLFATYSRHWYKDNAFAEPYDPAGKTFVAGEGLAALEENARATYGRIVSRARFGIPDADWANAPAAEPVATMSKPLFERDPSDDEEKEYGGADGGTGDSEAGACGGGDAEHIESPVEAKKALSWALNK